MVKLRIMLISILCIFFIGCSNNTENYNNKEQKTSIDVVNTEEDNKAEDERIHEATAHTDEEYEALKDNTDYLYNYYAMDNGGVGVKVVSGVFSSVDEIIENGTIVYNFIKDNNIVLTVEQKIIKPIIKGRNSFELIQADIKINEFDKIEIGLK